MNKKQMIAIVLGLLALNGCAARNGNIVLDTRDIDMNQYQLDLSYCHKMSEQANSKVIKGAVGGAAVGAIAGNIIGDSKTRRKGAKLGVLGGLLKGAAASKIEREKVVKNCLRHKGYAVLN